MKFSQKTLVAGTIIIFSISCKTTNQSQNAAKLQTEIDSVSYGLGLNIGTNMKQQGLDSVNAEVMAQAISDVFNEKDPEISMEQANQVLNTYFGKLKEEQMKEAVEKSKKFLEENAKKEGVTELPSGLQYKVLKEGTGESPDENDNVTVHYHGTTVDGEVFDSSVERGQPATFQVNKVIPGWTEALQLMKEGAKWELYIPPHLAYGERGAGQQIGPNETLIFEVELLKVEKQE